MRKRFESGDPRLYTHCQACGESVEGQNRESIEHIERQVSGGMEVVNTFNPHTQCSICGHEFTDYFDFMHHARNCSPPGQIAWIARFKSDVS